MTNIYEILKRHWGYSEFRPLQEEIIHSVLQQRDTLALLPTGGGKSVCFQIPALCFDGLCLVVSPLIALMKDQVYQLKQKGIKAEAIYSGMSASQISGIISSCVFAGVKFLYISPERLNTDEFKHNLKEMRVSLLAIDEAHCISQWGYDFRPAYLKIAEVREILPNVPVIALTATATPKVVEDIQEKLLFKAKNVLRKSFVRANLSYVVRNTINKRQSLKEILQKVKGSAVVYVRSRKATKDISDFLNREGISSAFYHAGLNFKDRTEKQDLWVGGKVRVMCSTNAFGMGIDKADVRLVVHLDLAESIEAYFQEAGRAGRDEKKAYAVQLLEKGDVVKLEEKILLGFPDVDFIKDIYEKLCIYLGVAIGDDLAYKDFELGAFVEKYSLNIATVLLAFKMLEAEELVEFSDSVYTRSQLKAVASSEIMHKFQQQYQQLEPIVKLILRTSEGIFEHQVSIDEFAYSKRLKVETGEVIRQLELLHQLRIFAYYPAKTKPQVSVLKPRVAVKNLNVNREFIAERANDWLTRMRSVKQYVTQNYSCRSLVLVRYFGEQNDIPCGICDVCVARKRSGLTKERFADIIRTMEERFSQKQVTANELKAAVNATLEDINAVIDFLVENEKAEVYPDGVIRFKNL